MSKPFISLSNMPTFGNVAAEDDSVLRYFLTTDAVARIDSGNILLVMGRKGSGKTALVRHFTEAVEPGFCRAVTLRDYPWRVHQSRADLGTSEVEAYVASWRYLIALQLASLLMQHPRIDNRTHEARSITEYFKTNYGGLNPDLGDVLRPPELKLSKTSFEPQIFGNKLGTVSLERSTTNSGRELNALTSTMLEAVTTLAGACGVDRLVLHFDELDQGLVSLSPERKEMLIGLILAVRATMRNNGKAQCDSARSSTCALSGKIYSSLTRIK